MSEDSVLDDPLQHWMPIQALPEVRDAREGAVADCARLDGREHKRLMQTGMLAAVDDRCRERPPRASLSRCFKLGGAIALDVGSATIGQPRRSLLPVA